MKEYLTFLILCVVFFAENEAEKGRRISNSKVCFNCIRADRRCLKLCYRNHQTTECHQCLEETLPECLAACGSETRYFVFMPAILFDIPPVSMGRASISRQSSSETKVGSHKNGYSTSKGACATASLGVRVNITIDVTIKATTEKSIVTVGTIITEHLKESFKEEFNEQFNTGYSLDVAFDWLGISSNGEYHESSHEDAFQEGETSVEIARKEFTEAIKEQDSKKSKNCWKSNPRRQNTYPGRILHFFCCRESRVQRWHRVVCCQ